MKKRILLITVLFALLALAIACGNSPANSNNAVKPAATVSNMTPVVTNMSTNAMTNSSMANSSMANKPATTNSSSANKLPPASSKMANPAASDDADQKVATTKKPPKGATAVCKDGTYSFAKNDSGQCSGHDGVDKKF